jgi:hypothetical protein
MWPTLPQGASFNKLESALFRKFPCRFELSLQGYSLHENFDFFFSFLITCKNGLPYYRLPITPSGHNFDKILHHIRKLPHKSYLFWIVWDLLMNPSYTPPTHDLNNLILQWIRMLPKKFHLFWFSGS